MLKNKDTAPVFILWLALITSVIIYVIASFIIKNNTAVKQSVPEFYKLLLIVVSFMSLVMGFLSIMGRRALLKKKYYSKFFKGNASPKGIYITAIVLSSALAEMIAIFGFILFILGNNMKIQIALAFVAVIIMLINKPNMEEYENLKKEIEEKNIPEGTL